jgi:hypothetical protein
MLFKMIYFRFDLNLLFKKREGGKKRHISLLYKHKNLTFFPSRIHNLATTTTDSPSRPHLYQTLPSTPKKKQLPKVTQQQPHRSAQALADPRNRKGLTSSHTFTHTYTYTQQQTKPNLYKKN